ncbi:MAG: LacI family DNA-binding transcriptional regulator [Clostridia bacterium]|nr:LacI family DNA-binding transcriptional regulator [Clostridia bacterium]
MTTIRDVANYLGVSVSTVSRYLNNHPDLNEETRQKIEKAIRELDYVPNSAARNVSRLSTRTIGLTIPDIQDSYFSDNAYGVERCMLENGYTLIYGSLNRSPKRMLDFVQYAREMRFDGLIITPEEWSEELLTLLRRTEIPVVALRRRPPETSEIPYVDADHYGGACRMVEHLTGLGHRSICHILLNTDIGRERMRGYVDSMERCGLEPRIISLPEMPAHKTMDAIAYGREAMPELLSRYPDTTAVFASTDPIGIGVMEYARNHGICVPDDLSVSGSGDLEIASLSWFEMTTIAFERYELGRRAAELLLKMIRKEDGRKESILFDTHLVLRKSTAHLNDRKEKEKLL